MFFLLLFTMFSENMVNKSKKNMAYTMLDATGAVDARLSEKLSSIPAVIRVRIL